MDTTNTAPDQQTPTKAPKLYRYWDRNAGQYLLLRKQDPKAVSVLVLADAEKAGFTVAKPTPGRNKLRAQYRLMKAYGIPRSKHPETEATQRARANKLAKRRAKNAMASKSRRGVK